jgi:general secretion pathway protein D
MNFNEISLKEFVDFVSEYSRKNIIYTANDLKGTVSIRIRDNISKPDILNILRNTLALYKLEIVSERDVLYIVRDASISEYTYLFEKNPKPSENLSDPIIVSVYQLENIDINQLQTFLVSMKSPNGQFALITTLNTVIIKDRKSNVSRIFQLFDDLSKKARDYNIEIIYPKNLNVKNIAATINDFFKERQKNTFKGGLPVVTPNVDSNSLIIAASQDDLTLIKEIIKSHDSLQTTLSTKNVLRLKYANAKDIETILNNIFFNKQQQQPPGNPRPADASAIQVASPITSDKATNSIVISGDREFYNQVTELVKNLDIERNQVSVEALILEVTLDKAAQFGVEWLALSSQNINANSTGSAIASSSNSGGLNTMATSLTSASTTSSTSSLGGVPTGLSVGYLSTIKFGNNVYPSFGALITALKTESGINIMSKPLLLSLDNEEADVFVGENRPFMISEKFDLNNNPIQTFDYRDVGIKLKILPRIIDADTVLLRINQEIKTVESIIGTNAAAPITLTRSTNTTIKTKNNMTVVISGLIKDTDTYSKSKIPILGDMPFIGALFRSENKTSEKTNLMIFLTVTVINKAQTIDDITKEKYKLFEQQISENNQNNRYNLKANPSIIKPVIESGPDVKTVEEPAQKNTTPENTAPVETVPEKVIPTETAPEKTVPVETVPEKTVH